MDNKNTFSRIKEIQSRFNEIDGNSKSISEYNIGDIITITFGHTSMSLKKVGLDLFEVSDHGGSDKVKNGDILKIKDENSIIEIGETLEFEIFRPIALEYKTDIIVQVK